MSEERGPCPIGCREKLWLEHGLLVRDPDQAAYWTERDLAVTKDHFRRDPYEDPIDPLTGRNYSVSMNGMRRVYSWDRGWQWQEESIR